ncbi:MAG: elongation factor G [Acidobacteria bacterium]|nr:elongation factor G [Acidobacteriota bacterium]MBV9475418.1 elongation factor G [Acidobacteriota bacterium]
MKVYSGSDIRNVAVVGHNDTGKTTLVSQLLFDAGALTRQGRVEDGTTVTDFDPDEIERKHSISAALAFAEWKDTKINLIDTPGFGIFVMEARGALRVADAAAVVVSGVTGVEVTTEKVWKFAEEYALPRILIVNKMDRDRASAARTLEALQKKFGKNVVPIQLPIGEEKDFSGIVDLVAMKAYRYHADGSGKFDAIDIPAELKADADAWRERLIEKVAEGDDTLMERFFEQGGLSQEELLDGLRREVAHHQIYPVLFTSASHNMGGHAVLDAFVSMLPSAAEAKTIEGKDRKGETITFDRRPEAFPGALVFKTFSDPFSGRVSLFRIYSGTLQSDHAYWNTARDHEERVGKLQVLQGKQQIPVPELRAGDIGAVAKLKDTFTGDTLAAKDHAIVFEHIRYPEAAIAFAVEPKARGDEDKLGAAIHRIIEEDPTIKFARDEQTKEFLISGQGQLHVEIVVAKLKKKYNVDVVLHPPKVPYRETITKPADAHGRHKKQSGGHGQFADCKITMEPLPRGADFEFVDEIFGGAIPRQYIPAVEKGIQDARVKGYLAGFPVVDFRVRLKDGQYHDVDSSEMAFKIAGSLAFQQAMELARPTLLEPIMHVDITAPSEYVGDIMGDLNSRRGRVEGVDAEEETQVVHARVPLAEMLTYGSTLRSITQGRGSFHMEYSHYEEVPKQLQEKIITESKKAKEAQAAAHAH